MTTSLTKLILSVLIASTLAMSLSSCGAVQYAMPLSDTLVGMKSALRGDPGTWVYYQEGLGYVLGWTAKSRYAFVMLDASGQVTNGIKNIAGLSANWKDSAEFIAYLESNNWKLVSSYVVPEAVYGEVILWSSLVSIGSRALPTIILFPIMPGPMELINPEVDA